MQPFERLTLSRRHFAKLSSLSIGTLALAILAACSRGGSSEETATTEPASSTATSSSASTTPTDATSTASTAETSASSSPATTASASPAAAEPTVAQMLTPTPSCVDDDDLETTLEQTEGPYYTPDTPERTSLLEADMPGTRLIVSGYVYSTECQPVDRALIDFWQADDSGEYDNVGYRLRGHQFTDAQGRYQLETIVPGLYPGRTRHIHVKVQAPNQPVLTTQLYFPGEPGNESDGIFDPSLLMEVQEAADGQNAAFDFALDLS